MRHCCNDHRAALTAAAARLHLAVSGIREDVVCADPAPEHVRLSGDHFVAVGEGCPSIRRERDLPDAIRSLDALDAQDWREDWRVGSERLDERRQHRYERLLELAWQATEFAIESREPLERRHALLGAVLGEVIVSRGDALEVRDEVLVTEARRLRGVGPVARRSSGRASNRLPISPRPKTRSLTLNPNASPWAL